MATSFRSPSCFGRFSTGVSLAFSRTISSSIHSNLHHDLTARRLPLIYDYLSPQPSHLLNLSLMDILPELRPQVSPENSLSVTLPSIRQPRRMAVGHHLIYFPPQVTLSQLLPDGTDILHYPGEPFNHRLWAGGNIKFPPEGGPLLNGQRAVCVEAIRDVTVKGQEGEEKVFVSIERRFTSVEESEDEQAIRRRVLKNNETNFEGGIITERRDLVFLRKQKSEKLEYGKALQERNIRLVKSPANPEISRRIIPTKALLFRYSALTFNAHLIHLDKAYTRDVEGHPDLLVHGPLSLTLMLTVLSFHLAKMGRVIREIEYRNLVPLYVDEEMRICAKPKESRDAGSWEVWIEGPSGGLAVKGTVWTENAQT
ncbi:hypothetical protein VTN77DRAFT_901 [Rasamsonia byssochlamydoides]|uniref:uncharacterized protein n=1 Tax=Rasamsonia byssochlamydoides TaxID=89139 RepID=UPI0037435626